jgi:hypothetical protein
MEINHSESPRISNLVAVKEIPGVNINRNVVPSKQDTVRLSQIKSSAL